MDLIPSTVIGAVTLDVNEHWISDGALEGLFWFYVAFATIISFVMVIIWFQTGHELQTFTPAAMFLFFPVSEPALRAQRHDSL